MRSSSQEAKRYVDSFQRNKPLDDACVGQIIESKNNEFTVGECVLGNFGSPELKAGCPEEIDPYFDNVGGKHLEAAVDNMKTFRGIVFSGMISQYNAVPPLSSAGPSNLSLAVPNRLRLQGFIVRDHYDMLNEFHHLMTKWISEGKIKWKETIAKGLENAPKAVIGLFKGENFGKMLIKIGLEV